MMLLLCLGLRASSHTFLHRLGLVKMLPRMWPVFMGIITQTVSDQNPIAIFGVSKILLPREIFGKNPIMSVKSPPDIGAPPP
ncbi:hypothetical protein RYX36_006797 [Vicia faba]